jgi:hypothetical protein
MPELSPNDRELILQLLDDVAVIEDQFLFGTPRPSAIRTVLVPMLRRWAVEGVFHKAQKLIRPISVGFPIRSNRDAIDYCKRGVYVHWTGMIEFGGIGFQIGQFAANHLGPDGKPTVGAAPYTSPAPQKANLFFEQKMFFWKGQFYTRADVTKMLANALGGVHLSFERKEDEQHINEIKHYFGVEVKNEGKNIQMLVGDNIGVARADPARRPKVSDATELVAMDTARIFASGVRASKESFDPLLQQ